MIKQNIANMRNTNVLGIILFMLITKELVGIRLEGSLSLYAELSKCKVTIT